MAYYSLVYCIISLLFQLLPLISVALTLSCPDLPGRKKTKQNKTPYRVSETHDFCLLVLPLLSWYLNLQCSFHRYGFPRERVLEVLSGIFLRLPHFFVSLLFWYCHLIVSTVKNFRSEKFNISTLVLNISLVEIYLYLDNSMQPWWNISCTFFFPLSKHWLNTYLLPSLMLESKYRVANKTVQTVWHASEPRRYHQSARNVWMDRCLTSTAKPRKTVTIPSTDLNSTENHTPGPDKLTKNLTHARIFYSYFDHVHFFICSFILISASQNFISFNTYFKYVLRVPLF